MIKKKKRMREGKGEIKSDTKRGPKRERKIDIVNKRDRQKFNKEISNSFTEKDCNRKRKAKREYRNSKKERERDREREREREIIRGE